MLKRISIAVILLLVISTFITTLAEAAIKLKVAVVNPSSTSKKTTPVKFDLPKGIAPEDVIDIGDMELHYDFNKGCYYVYQMVTLEPGEKRILEARLEDIWVVPAEEINFLKTHTETLAENLKETKHAQTGTALFKKIKDGLDEISKRQEDASLSTTQRMNLHYEDMGMLDDVKKDIGMLENLVIDVGGIVEDRVEVPTTLAVSVVKEEEPKPEEAVELKVRISNPSEKRKQIAPIKYILPEEVTPRFIIDSGGLDAAYDFNNERFYVYKEGVELEPSETKVFVVKVRDIWKIPEVEIEALQAHTNNLMLLLEGTEYFSQGEPIANRVYINLDDIIRLQSMKVDIVKHIAHYRGNTSTLEETKQYVAQLEKIVSQSGSTPGVTIAIAERIEGGGPEVKRATGYEGLRLIAESIFRGKAPDVATTWKIIFTILVFIGVLGAAFFGLWYMQVKRREKKE